MISIRKEDTGNFGLAVLVFLACTYLLASLHGFQFGYDAALKAQFPDFDPSGIVVHGTSLMSRIVGGIVICWFLSLLYLGVLLPDKVSRGFRLLALSGATLAVAYTLYYKALVYRRTGSPGFLNPYEDLFIHLTVIEGVCFLCLATLLTIELWAIAKGWFTPTRSDADLE